LLDIDCKLAKQNYRKIKRRKGEQRDSYLLILYHDQQQKIQIGTEF